MSPWVRTGLWVAGLGGAGVGTYFLLRAAGVVGELPRNAGGGLLVDTLTMTTTKEEFVRGVMSAAARARPQMSQTSRGLLAAWAALESGWGKTRQAKLANNLWNVSKGSWTGPTIPGTDVEYVAGAVEAKPIKQDWRQYATLDAAVADILTLLQNSRYVNYREAYADLLAGSPLFALRLGKLDVLSDGKTKVMVDTRSDAGGYYTLPRSEYQRSISKLWTEVQAIVVSSGISGLQS